MKVTKLRLLEFLVVNTFSGVSFNINALKQNSFCQNSLKILMTLGVWYKNA